jgi:hypothetical protein
MLLGGSGSPPFSRLLAGRQGAMAFPAASRVSISEMFGSSTHLDVMSVLTYTPIT